MTGTYERVAGFLSRYRWIAAVMGVLVWGTWLLGLVLGGSRMVGTFDLKADPPSFQLAGTLGLPGWDRDPFGQFISIDHLAFYSPARMIREGRASEIYDHDALLDYQRSLFPPGEWTAFEAYRNPPFYALLYVPTAGLPYAASAWIWNALGLVCLFLSVRWLGAKHPWVAAGWALTFFPVMAAVSYGQNSLLSLAVFAGTYRLLGAGRPLAAGLVAGLLWFKPPLLLGLIVWGLLDLRRLWPAAVGVLITGVGLVLGSYLVIPGAWEGFRAQLQDNLAFANFDWWKMHNARSFWRLLLPQSGDLPTILWLASAAVGLAVFVRVWVRQRENLPAIFGAAVFVMLWASPHTMIYEWTLAVAPAVLWWTHQRGQRSAWLVLLAVGWFALLIGTDVGRIQNWYQRYWLELSDPLIVQVSVPMLGWVGWRAAQLLTQAGSGESAEAVRSRSPSADFSGVSAPGSP